MASSESLTRTLSSHQQPTIDIEAAIRDDRLDFGVFAPDARLDRHRASKLIERMKHEMTSLIKACEVS